jgi:hypothetical protein
MNAHLSTRDLARALTIAMALLAGLSACKARGRSAPDAPEPALAPGALMDYAGSGGIAGKTTHVTVFADGRVEGRSDRAPPR